MRPSVVVSLWAVGCGGGDPSYTLEPLLDQQPIRAVVDDGQGPIAQIPTRPPSRVLGFRSVEEMPGIEPSNGQTNDMKMGYDHQAYVQSADGFFRPGPDRLGWTQQFDAPSEGELREDWVVDADGGIWGVNAFTLHAWHHVAGSGAWASVTDIPVPYALEFTLIDGASGYLLHLLDPSGEPLTLALPCDTPALGGCQNDPYRPVSPTFLPNGDILFGLSAPDAPSRLIVRHPSGDWAVLVDDVPGPVINLVADGDDVLVSWGTEAGSAVTPYLAPDYRAGRVAELATLAQINRVVRTETGGLYTVGGGGLLSLTR